MPPIKNNNKVLYYGIGIFIAFITLFVLVFLIFDPQNRHHNNHNHVDDEEESEALNYNSTVLQKSSASTSVVQALDVYEIPYELMHDLTFSDKLNRYINAEVFVYRSGTALSTAQNEVPFQTYTYRFEKWNSSLNNMFTRRGILYSADNQGFLNSTEVNTRFFIKLSIAATNSASFASFCSFISNSAANYTIRRTTVQVLGTPVTVTTENRPDGEYVANWQGDTVFGPETNVILCGA
jgi:hypothetical protein